MKLLNERPIGGEALDVGQSGLSAFDLVTDAQHVYIAAEGAANIEEGTVVAIDPATGVAAPLTKALADKRHTIAISTGDVAADTMGLFIVQGVAEVAGLSAMAKEVALYTSGTAGSIDDDSSSQTKILGIVSSETLVSAGLATCYVSYPHVA